jgi:hypothetical protein
LEFINAPTRIRNRGNRDDDKRPKQLIIVGQFKPNDDEVEFINYVKRNLKPDFSYENIDFHSSIG